MPNEINMSEIVDLNGVAEIRDWIKNNFLSKADADQMMASKIKITFYGEFAGQSYTVTGGNSESYSGTIPASLVVEQTIRSLNTTYTVVCESADHKSYSQTVEVGSYYGVYTAEIVGFRAYLVCTTDAGAAVQAVNGTKVYTAIANSTGTATLNIGAAGTYTVTASLGGQTSAAKTVSVAESGETYTCNVPISTPAVEIVPWATGTDAQIAAMVAAMDAGTLSIEDTGWSVGDERTVNLAAMAATGVGESHGAQTATLVLMDSGHYELAEATPGGDTMDHFVVGLKNFLANGTSGEWGYMNSSNTNAGSWDGCARRAWCNQVFREAVPEVLRDCFKQFKVITAETYNGSTVKTSLDYFALFAEKEIFGTRSYSNQAEADALTQIEWYKTAANRIKKQGDAGSAYAWWGRSPLSGYSYDFCYVNSSGNAYYGYASISNGVAPFGCI